MIARTPSRLPGLLADSLGIVLAVWAIPLAIVAVGLPIALLFKIASIIWP